MRHHFVSQFYLSRWEEPQDGRIPTFLRKTDGQIDLVRFAKQSTGYEHDLYAFTNVDQDDKHVLEHEFFTPSLNCAGPPNSGANNWLS
ncbi:DUF4238 domain-containing protein [Dongia deserti]|uniref:DUF4238 domain-containing protein n=1 Tax=Dongia deserti TaxID=2268030 RepID=UPI000E65BEC5